MTGYIEQPSLFSVSDVGGTYRTGATPSLEISAALLEAWKQRVFQYQKQVQVTPIAQQGNLFEVGSSTANNSEPINPFELPPQNTEFWRWKATDVGVAAFYFVIDYDLPILLYVGETVKFNQRWKGEHDCKRYLLNYRQAHYTHHMPSRLGIAFWPDAPTQTRHRQKIESTLIYKWRSPFNKENWEFWGTLFVGGKSSV